MNCDICEENIAMWATPYSIGRKTLCSDCFADDELVDKLKDEWQEQASDDQLSEREAARRAADSIVLTNTPGVPGATVAEVLDLVFGEAIIGANIFSDAFAGVRDVVGGRSNSYQKRFAEARSIAVEEMALQAHEKNAVAVVRVTVDYEMVRDTMMMVTASGTAVLTEPQPPEGSSVAN